MLMGVKGIKDSFFESWRGAHYYKSIKNLKGNLIIFETRKKYGKD